jgi:hypothetical protein
MDFTTQELLQQALSKIGTEGYTGIDGLRRLVNETSAIPLNAAPDATLLLYSERVGDLPGWQVAAGISDSTVGANGFKQVVTMGDTVVAKLLANDNFTATLEQAVLADGGDNEAFRRLLDGTDLNGNRVSSNSFWDLASHNLAASHTGNVVTLTDFAHPDSVFVKTELDAALNNSNVRSINGVPREDLLRLRSDLLSTSPNASSADLDYANRILLDTINTHAHEQNLALRIAVAADGVTVTGVGSTTYLERIGHAGVGTDLPDGLANRTPVHFPSRESMVNSQLANDQFKLYEQERYRVAEAAGDSTRMAASGRWLNKLGVMGDVLALGLVVHDANAAFAAGDTEGAQQILSDWTLEFAGGLAGGILAAQLAASLLAPLYLAGPAGAFVAGGLSLLAGIAGALAGEQVVKSIAAYVNTAFTSATDWRPRPDPLVLDLDGDGIETIGINTAAPIRFDHNADGIATGTGWIASDDAFLVMDRDGNGSIDTGRELFGDSTALTAGGTAVDGFAALAQEDTAADGRVDALDARFADLRLWRDLNQDGVSQAGELFSLESQNVASLNVAKTANSTPLANGNRIADLGQFVRADGSLGTMGDVDVAENAFYSRFTQAVPTAAALASAGSPYAALAAELAAKAETLPQMMGAGRVRDMRSVASLSSSFSAALDAFAADNSATGQRAGGDGVGTAGVSSSSIETRAHQRADATLWARRQLRRGQIPERGCPRGSASNDEERRVA